MSLLISLLAASQLGHTFKAPLDYSRPSSGSASIYYEFGAPFDKKKPTVFVISDGQQFFVRKGRVKMIQAETFGDRFNVVGIVGRGDCPDAVQACKTKQGKVDWAKAYRFFCARQWVEDIEAVRWRVLGSAPVLLYGQSGGAFLTHQYLSVYGRHVRRAATPAAVMPYLVRRLGFRSDRFWEEIGPESQPLALQALERYKGQRAIVIQALQRQNFFVGPDKIAEARATLIKQLAEGDDEALAKARKEYQVDAIQAYMNGDQAIPMRVRLFEFYAPSGEGRFLQKDRVYPNIENSRNMAAPLLGFKVPEFEFAACHLLPTEVLVVAGIKDHTVDYRTSIALAASYPRGDLLLLDDDHMFSRLSKGQLSKILQEYLLGGSSSAGYRGALKGVKGIGESFLDLEEVADLSPWVEDLG